MKILVISLLRLGDILMHAELLPALKKMHPAAKIDFLINQQFSSVRENLPEISQWHLLDRQFIQQVLVEQNHSPRAAFENLKALVDTINAEKYDLVLNATHNNLSVRLMDLIKASVKRGAAFENGKKTAFKNLWLNYFNEQFSSIQGSRFHYVEVLHRALDIPMIPVRKQNLRSRGKIYLQVLTADSKKNWGLRQFANLKRAIEISFPFEQVQVICSPGERDQVLKYFTDLEIVSPNLKEAQRLLQNAKLLITGDTSIQHLAAREACPVIGLFLGSADPVKTSPWLAGSSVLQGKVACSPCKGSEACSQKSHLCAENLQVVDVMLELAQYLNLKASGNLRQNGEHFLFSEQEAFEQIVWGAYLDGKNANDLLILPEQMPASAHRIDEMQQVLLSLSHKVEEISKVIFGKISRMEALSQAQAIQSMVAAAQKQFPEYADSFLKMNQSYQLINTSFFEFLKVLRAGLQEAQTLNGIRERLVNIQKRTSQEAFLE